MATITDKKSVNATLTSTTVDRVQLLQFWDQIEITNLGDTTFYVTDNGATDPVAAAEGTVAIPAAQSKILKARPLTTSVPDGSAVICHEIRIIGDGDAYQVCGLVSAHP